MINEGNCAPTIEQGLSSLLLQLRQLIIGFDIYIFERKKCESKLNDPIACKENNRKIIDGQLEHLFSVLYSGDRTGICYTKTANSYLPIPKKLTEIFLEHKNG